MNWPTVKKQFARFWPLLILILGTIIFFWPFFFKGVLPVPADTIVGLYHPWREIVWDDFTAGVPFKNFLITDPVRQLYPWRRLAISLFQNGEWPSWNPYSLTGQPLLANFQSAALYPLNIFFFFLPFNLVWSCLIILQPFLAGLFLYLFLRQLKLSQFACLIGSLSFSFSGFFIAWLEWGTVLHTALWLPLLLLSLEKIILAKKKTFWSFVFLFGLAMAFFAGHLQTFFYLFLLTFIYLGWRIRRLNKARPKLIRLFLMIFFLFITLTAIQWFPAFQLIKLSARAIDLDWRQSGWFLPWPHLVQFWAPDFFGNPATLNYWGEWNYAEFVGYLGVMPLFFAFLAFFGKRKKEIVFFSLFALAALSFALPTPWAKIIYWLKIPFLATSQPTRLLFLVVFCLAVLAAYGLDQLMIMLKNKKMFFKPLGLFGLVYVCFWIFTILAPRFWPKASWLINLSVSKRNLVLPTFLFLFLVVNLVFSFFLRRLKFGKKLAWGVFGLGILLGTAFDLFRFGWKFTPFVKEEWLFPATETIVFLQNDPEVFRIMSTDRRLMPPNFTLAYGLQTVDGYDPLYLRRYGELMAASERGEPNIEPPFGFNRIITPQNYPSPLIDLLNVKYVLSLDEINSSKLKLVFQEGQTRVYENQAVFPRAFMVYDYQVAKTEQEAVNLMMTSPLSEKAILEEIPEGYQSKTGEGQVKIKTYSAKKIVLAAETDQPGILVLTDAFYPGWQAKIDGQKTKIYRADYHFRAIIVPGGRHEITFHYGRI